MRRIEITSRVPSSGAIAMTASTKDALANPGYRPIRLLPGAMPRHELQIPECRTCGSRGWLEEGWLEEGWLEEGWLEEGWLEEGWLEEGWLEEGGLEEGGLEEGWLEEGWLEEGWLEEGWLEEGGLEEGGLEEGWLEEGWLEEGWLEEGWLEEMTCWAGHGTTMMSQCDNDRSACFSWRCSRAAPAWWRPAVRSSQQSYPCGSARRASLTGLTPTGRVAWRTALPHPQDFGTTPAIVAGGTVYADLSGAVTAVNESNGRIRWSRALGTDVYGEWLIGRTLVVDVDQVGRHAQVVGLNPTSGALDWRYRPGGNGLYGDPVPAGDIGLVIVASPHELGLVDATSGRLRWRHWIASLDQPVTDGTTVAVASGSTIRGFAVATGDLRWTRGGVDSMALPTLDDGVVAIGAQVTPDQTPIAGYELATGRQAWVLSLDAGSWQLTATTAGLVAVQNAGRPRWPRPRRAGHGPHRLAGKHRSPSLFGEPSCRLGSNLAMVVQLPQDGPSFAALRNLTTGSLVVRHRLASSQVPLTLAALGPDLYGNGLGPDGKTESGFVERIGLDGVIWRVVLPQPAQTSPVALAEGGIAVQTEDLGCATPLLWRDMVANCCSARPRRTVWSALRPLRVGSVLVTTAIGEQALWSVAIALSTPRKGGSTTISLEFPVRPL